MGEWDKPRERFIITKTSYRDGVTFETSSEVVEMPAMAERELPSVESLLEAAPEATKRLLERYSRR